MQGAGSSGGATHGEDGIDEDKGEGGGKEADGESEKPAAVNQGGKEGGALQSWVGR